MSRQLPKPKRLKGNKKKRLDNIFATSRDRPIEEVCTPQSFQRVNTSKLINSGDLPKPTHVDVENLNNFTFNKKTKYIMR
jgi:hypothetical protein